MRPAVWYGLGGALAFASFAMAFAIESAGPGPLPSSTAPLVLAPLVLGALFFLRGRSLATRSQERAENVSLRLCATCGYDLRASKDRCPECGTAMIEAAT